MSRNENENVSLNELSEKYGTTILHIGIEHDWPNVVEFALKCGVSIDIEDIFGRTARNMMENNVISSYCLQVLNGLRKRKKKKRRKGKEEKKFFPIPFSRLQQYSSINQL